MGIAVEQENAKRFIYQNFPEWDKKHVKDFLSVNMWFFRQDREKTEIKNKEKTDNNTYVHERALSANIRPWFKENEIEDTFPSAPRFVESYNNSNNGTFVVPMVM